MTRAGVKLCQMLVSGLPCTNGSPYSLFGLFFGYVDLDNQVYWNTNGYEYAWRSPDIDMLYSPAAYRDCRELTLTMVKHSAFWWFDFFGGYYNSPEYERELTLENEIFRRLSNGSRESAGEAARSFVEKLQ